MRGEVIGDNRKIIEVKAAFEVIGPNEQPTDQNDDQPGRKQEEIVFRFLD